MLSSLSVPGLRVTRPLSSDLMSDRFSATLTESGRDRTLWLFSPHHPIASPDRLEALKASMWETNARSHPNLLTVERFGAAEGRVWATTEATTESLQQTLSMGPASVDQALSWMAQIAAALAVMHDAGRVHGAIGPDTVLLDGAHRARLCDPAWLLELPPTLDGRPRIRHPDLRAPEQIAGPMAPPDRRMDVYAVGALLAWAVTGQAPAASWQLGRPTGALAMQPVALQEVVLRALQQRPAERYADGARLARALLRAMEGLSVASSPGARAALGHLGPAYAPVPPPPDRVPELAPPPPADAPPTAALPEDEADRLAVLLATALLDTAAEERFDRYTRLVRNLLDVPTALVSLVDQDRQWFKSRQGLDAQQTPRSMAFCAHALHHPDQLFEVADAAEDPRFRSNPLVTGPLGVRFYAGHPVQVDGHPIGTVCVLDQQPRVLTIQQRAVLRHVARMVDEELDGERRRRTDPETGLSDLDGFALLANLSLARRRSRGEAVTLAHISSDPAALSPPRLAAALLAHLGDAEVVARVAPDAYALLVPAGFELSAAMGALVRALGATDALQWSAVTLDPSEEATVAALLAHAEQVTAAQHAAASA